MCHILNKMSQETVGSSERLSLRAGHPPRHHRSLPQSHVEHYLKDVFNAPHTLVEIKTHGMQYLECTTCGENLLHAKNDETTPRCRLPTQIHQHLAASHHLHFGRVLGHHLVPAHVDFM